jgi:ankyrin repeat protein
MAASRAMKHVVILAALFLAGSAALEGASPASPGGDKKKSRRLAAAARARDEKEILKAAASGELETVRAVLMRHPDLVNAVDESPVSGLPRGTPLHEAAENDRTNVVIYLLQHRAEINFDGVFGTPLQAACRGNHLGIVALLLASNALVNPPSITGETPLHVAVQFGSVELVRLLLDHKADIEAKEYPSDERPLHRAAFYGKTETVRLLLERGAKLDVKDNQFGWTALHNAAYGGRTEVTKLLLEKGANVNARGELGQTPLDVARESGDDRYRKVAPILKRYGGK